MDGPRKNEGREGLELERLAAAIRGVEAGLEETRRRLPPEKRAELILAAYRLIEDEGRSEP